MQIDRSSIRDQIILLGLLFGGGGEELHTDGEECMGNFEGPGYFD